MARDPRASHDPLAPEPGLDAAPAPAAAFARGTIPAAAAGEGADVTVDEARPAQVIAAFGGAFNEQAWDALAGFDEATRAAALRLLFDARYGLALD